MKNITFIQKKELVKKSCQFFKKIKLINESLKNKGQKYGLNPDAINSIIDSQPITFFEKILNLLDLDHRLIIETDFINQIKNPLWYLNHWSKTTYYKLKHEAIEEFLSFIYE